MADREGIIPSPGIHRGVPFAQYAAWRAVNKSSLDEMAEHSPMHYMYALEHPRLPTPEMLIGQGLHALTLEGESAYAAEFCVGGPINPKTNAGYGRDTKAFAEWAEAQGPGKRFISADQDEIIRGMHKALMAKVASAQFIKDDGENELSIVWEDAETGILCKARIDMQRPTWEAIGDLKTTKDASPESFTRSIHQYGYHRQAAWYLDGWAAVCELTIDTARAMHFPFLCVENTPPFGVAVYRLDYAGVEIGRTENHNLLRVLKNCRDTGNYYGYSSEFQDIGLPAWAVRRAMEVI